MSSTSNPTAQRNIKQRVKDYAATILKNLKSQFGGGGHKGPTPSQQAPSPTSFTQSHTHHHPSSQPSDQYLKNNSNGGKEKDYASAFASLQTQFGASGHTPFQPNVGYDKPKPRK